MKTTILTTAFLLTLALGTSQPTFASNGDKITISSHLVVANKINTIEVRGNVELYVSDGNTDNVKIYGNNYTGSPLIADQNGVLRISSFQTKKLVVWVTASDLNNLEVYDNAEVKSFGKLSGIGLDVKLFSNASATLDLDAYHANVTLNGHAKVVLSGDINEVELKYDQASVVDTTNLVAGRMVKAENFEGIANNNL